jgi:hypothetical protein
MVFGILLGETLTIAFNRQPNSTDLEFGLPLMEHAEAWQDVAGCFRELWGN